MKVFLTGASGFIGSVVAHRLVERGDTIRCLVRASSRVDRLSRLHGLAERTVGDVLDPSSFEQSLEGCDAVVHLASPVGWSARHARRTERAIVEGTRHVLRIAARAQVERFVYVSSIVALNGSPRPAPVREADWGSPPIRRHPYVSGKIGAEIACREFDDTSLSVVVVNPALVFGPDDIDLVTAGSLLELAASNPVVVCDGGSAVAHVDDVAAGIVAALERGRRGERYLLGGENVTWAQLAALTLEVLGLRRRILRLPRIPIRIAAALGRRVGLPLPFDSDVVPYATRYWFADSSKAARELGVSFRGARETVESTLAWCRQAGHLRGARA